MMFKWDTKLSACQYKRHTCAYTHRDHTYSHRTDITHIHADIAHMRAHARHNTHTTHAHHAITTPAQCSECQSDKSQTRAGTQREKPRLSQGSQVPRHLPEWTREISTVPIFDQARQLSKERGLGSSTGKENPAELDSCPGAFRYGQREQKSHVDQNDKFATFSLSVNRNCQNMASRSFSFEQKSARCVKKNHHKDNWKMAAATRSSDANFQQSADCRKWESLEPNFFHSETVVPCFCLKLFVCFPQVDVFQHFSEKTSIFQPLRSCLSEFSELGVLLRTCLLAGSPPPLLLWSLPTSNLIQPPPPQKCF